MSFLLLILEFYKTNARLIINLFIELFDLKGILQFCKIKSENFLVYQIKVEKLHKNISKNQFFLQFFFFLFKKGFYKSSNQNLN